MMADSNRSPEEIEREIAETRMHADRQITAIEERLSPNHLMQEALDYMRKDSGTRLFSDVAEAAMKNPIPTALIALGAGWLIANGYRDRPSAITAGRRPPRAMLPATQRHHVHLGEGDGAAEEAEPPSATKIIGRNQSERPAAESARAFEKEPTRAETREHEPAPGVAAVTVGTPAASGASAAAGKREEEVSAETPKSQTERLREEARRRAADAPRPETHHYHAELSDPTKPEGTSPSPEETTGAKRGNKSARESASVFEKNQRPEGERPRAP